MFAQNVCVKKTSQILLQTVPAQVQDRVALFTFNFVFSLKRFIGIDTNLKWFSLSNPSLLVAIYI